MNQATRQRHDAHKARLMLGRALHRVRSTRRQFWRDHRKNWANRPVLINIARGPLRKYRKLLTLALQAA